MGFCLYLNDDMCELDTLVSNPFPSSFFSSYNNKKIFFLFIMGFHGKEKINNNLASQHWEEASFSVEKILYLVQLVHVLSVTTCGL